MNVKKNKRIEYVQLRAAFRQLLALYFGVDAHFLSDSVDEHS